MTAGTIGSGRFSSWIPSSPGSNSTGLRCGKSPMTFEAEFSIFAWIGFLVGLACVAVGEKMRGHR